MNAAAEKNILSAFQLASERYWTGEINSTDSEGILLTRQVTSQAFLIPGLGQFCKGGTFTKH